MILPLNWFHSLEHSHSEDKDFVSEFVSDYFSLCSYAESTACSQISHFVKSSVWYIVDIVRLYCLTSKK